MIPTTTAGYDKCLDLRIGDRVTVKRGTGTGWTGALIQKDCFVEGKAIEASPGESLALHLLAQSGEPRKLLRDDRPGRARLLLADGHDHMIYGSVTYRRWRLCQKVSQARQRAEIIDRQAGQNFDDWDTMTVEEKDAANRAAQRAISDLARACIRLANSELDDLSDEANV